MCVYVCVCVCVRVCLGGGSACDVRRIARMCVVAQITHAVSTRSTLSKARRQEQPLFSTGDDLKQVIRTSPVAGLMV